MLLQCVFQCQATRLLYYCFVALYFSGQAGGQVFKDLSDVDVDELLDVWRTVQQGESSWTSQVSDGLR